MKYLRGDVGTLDEPLIRAEPVGPVRPGLRGLSFRFRLISGVKLTEERLPRGCTPVTPLPGDPKPESGSSMLVLDWLLGAAVS